MPKPIALPPTIDDHAADYLELKRNLTDATTMLEDKKAELIKLCEKSGTVPAGAEKSLRLEGDKYEITVSFGQSTSIDPDAVEKLKGEVTPSVFKKLFRSKLTYLIAPTAQAALDSLPKPIRALFGKVQITKPKAPSLSVQKKGGK